MKLAPKTIVGAAPAPCTRKCFECTAEFSGPQALAASCRISFAGRDGRHHRAIDDAKTVEAAHPQAAVDDGVLAERQREGRHQQLDVGPR